jgi:hypothetical protein
MFYLISAILIAPAPAQVFGLLGLIVSVGIGRARARAA